MQGNDHDTLAWVANSDILQGTNAVWLALANKASISESKLSSNLGFKNINRNGGQLLEVNLDWIRRLGSTPQILEDAY